MKRFYSLPGRVYGVDPFRFADLVQLACAMGISVSCDNLGPVPGVLVQMFRKTGILLNYGITLFHGQMVLAGALSVAALCDQAPPPVLDIQKYFMEQRVSADVLSAGAMFLYPKLDTRDPGAIRSYLQQAHTITDEDAGNLDRAVKYVQAARRALV